MNFLGVYHSDYFRSGKGVCDAPCISKGKMMLCAPDTVSENHHLAMAYGRIRNRLKLASELACKVNSPDAYLVLKAYQRWGNNYFHHIEGPAITCVLDCSADRMILARDRMGEQPLFYAKGADGRIAFSDHPDSLLKTASAEPVVNAEGLCEIFGLGPARTPGKTPLRDILTLNPGCALIVDNGRSRTEPYFAIHAEKHTESEQETIRHTRLLLEQAIEPIRAMKPGIMLSGGLDSTALAALLSRDRVMDSFSIEYKDDSADFRPNAFRPERDAPYIDLSVRAFSTRHHQFVIEQAALADALEAAVSARGFPGMADIDSSLLLFAGQIRKHTQTIVSGECGDEVFGGYPWFRNADSPLTTFPWSGSVDLRARILRKEIREKLKLHDYVQTVFQKALDRTGIEGPEDDPELNLKRMQLLCLQFFMPNLQERAVRMCGRYGVNVLTPLCDERLVQYVFNVPWKMKFTGNMEKGLFRAAVADLMPAALNTRKKSPYPKTSSPIYTEIVRGLTMAMLANREAPILEWIDADYVRSIAESALEPTETPWFGQLMAGPQMLGYLWQVNTWMRERNITVSL